VESRRVRGRSERPEAVAAYTLPELVADAVGILDVLGIERAHLVGHDWGAALGWAIAALAPERVNGADTRRLPPVAAPTLELYGENDPYLSEDAMLASERFVAGGWRYERLDGTGHWLAPPARIEHAQAGLEADRNRPTRTSLSGASVVNRPGVRLGPLTKPGPMVSSQADVPGVRGGVFRICGWKRRTYS
jgi:pimeloyl-ACP methyl ester carboxylesterase